MMRRWTINLASALALAIGPGSALAAQPTEPTGPDDVEVEPIGSASPIEFRGEIELMSDYRFRGISRSDEDPAVQANLLAVHRSGLYAGTRATSLSGIDSFRSRDPSFRDLGEAQIDVYAGYGAPIGGGFEVDAGLLYSFFAGGEGETDYFEPYASLSYLIGPAYVTGGARYAPSQQALGDEDMLYLFGQLDIAIPFRPWRFKALLGHQDWGQYGDYWTWSAGVEHRLRLGDLPPIDIGLSYVDTDLPSVTGQDAGLVGSLRLRF